MIYKFWKNADFLDTTSAVVLNKSNIEDICYLDYKKGWFKLALGSGKEIANDWYEVRCQISTSNHLKVFLSGLKDKKNQFYVDFGQAIFYESIDEGWDLKESGYYDHNNQPFNNILIELFDSFFC